MDELDQVFIKMSPKLADTVSVVSRSLPSLPQSKTLTLRLVLSA